MSVFWFVGFHVLLGAVVSLINVYEFGQGIVKSKIVPLKMICFIYKRKIILLRRLVNILDMICKYDKSAKL